MDNLNEYDSDDASTTSVDIPQHRVNDSDDDHNVLCERVKSDDRIQTEIKSIVEKTVVVIQATEAEISINSSSQRIAEILYEMCKDFEPTKRNLELPQTIVDLLTGLFIKEGRDVLYLQCFRTRYLENKLRKISPRENKQFFPREHPDTIKRKLLNTATSSNEDTTYLQEEMQKVQELNDNQRELIDQAIIKKARDKTKYIHELVQKYLIRDNPRERKRQPRETLRPPARYNDREEDLSLQPPRKRSLKRRLLLLQEEVLFYCFDFLLNKRLHCLHFNFIGRNGCINIAKNTNRRTRSGQTISTSRLVIII
jgi:hypothetical protein